MNYKERMDELVKQLNEANYRYYVLDNPIIQDFEYDRLLRELEVLEGENPQFALPDSPTNRGGGEALSQFQKYTHPVPLMSLQDVFSPEELREFLEKNSQILENSRHNKNINKIIANNLKKSDFMGQKCVPRRYIPKQIKTDI